ncbi:DUF4832 domain-containing protein [Chitinophaga sancti]|uniref:DUF4832 domain-containing protein n=1 Tax=Chitinophaga sancti TaxID=1004 RepID=A0A1K1RBC3_9BACT|nr:DUF4832 domain-containing protein [Chitinophaga sancti]WQD65583.1 DUF4832 domain-containing protein [Chitinophaga sancti]WQG88794.1 DUF4832 domain-containing protein [Chitinophaga sancti]SFW69455.1 protein of unknown function [Chitinophaga sancti]
MRAICLLFPVILVAGSCDKTSGGENNVGKDSTTITYTASTEDFTNPERGFYRYSETTVDNFTALDAGTLATYKSGTMPSGGTFSVMSTLVFRYFIMSGYTGKALPAAFLTNLSKDFATARAAGIKLIPRFTYTISVTAGTCSEGWICTPYGDAPKSIVLSHIAQLKPILQANADVIATLQLGFIGVWGENFYTDYFGDASSNGQKQLLDQNWKDRSEVLKAMLDALPQDRMVQIRLPQLKQKFVYGASALPTASAMTAEEAASGTDKARIGYHNDCFLSSANDYGTFADYGSSSSTPVEATTAMRNFTSMDSKYVVVGGETCSDEYSPQNDCEPTGHAEQEFSDMHYSFLNADYNAAVNNDWQTGGCLDNIKRKLGYRLVLKDASFLSSTDSLAATIHLQNVGYAAPYNPRPVQLLLRNMATKKIDSLTFITEVRKWVTGDVTLRQSFKLPSGMPAGTYELLLNLPDGYNSLRNMPAYSIRLANNNVWESTTGYNNLNHKITIQ